jgi:hypothetical protein
MMEEMMNRGGVGKIVCAAAIAALGWSAAAPTSAEAQSARRPPPPPAPTVLVGPNPSGMSFLAIGGQRLDLGDLNARMVAAGYPAFSEDFLTVGFGGYGARQSVLLGFEVHGLSGPSETTANGQFRTRLTGGHGVLTLGYAALTTPRADLFPMVGIGAGGVVLEILDRGAPTFDDVLRNPPRNARLSSGGLVIDTSLGTTLRLTARPRPARGGAGGLAVGLRAGYTFSPLTGEWRTDAENDVAGGPDVSTEGAYLRATIGGWSTRPRR